MSPTVPRFDVVGTQSNLARQITICDHRIESILAHHGKLTLDVVTVSSLELPVSSRVIGSIPPCSVEPSSP